MTMTLAPALRAISIVGRDALMRASLVIFPSLTGTFRSSRISTRLPRRSRLVIFLIVIDSFHLAVIFQTVSHVHPVSPPLAPEPAILGSHQAQAFMKQIQRFAHIGAAKCRPHPAYDWQNSIRYRTTPLT